MLFKMRFNVVYTDGTTATVTTRPSTDMAFERRYHRTVASMFADVPLDEAQDMQGDEPAPGALKAMLRWVTTSLSDEHALFLAWHSSKADTEFEDWVELVDSIEWDFGGSAAVDPTQPAA